MSRHAMIRLLVVLLLITVLAPAASALAGQATPAANANPFGDLDLPQLDITITDTAFEGVPAELVAGRYVLAVMAATSDPFSVGGVFLQMSDDITTEEFVEYVASPVAGDGPHLPQPWYYEIRRSGAPYVMPGQTRYAVIDLMAGDWVFTAEYRVAPQAPVPVTVTGDLPADLPTPDADVTIEMTEFAVSASAPLGSGPQIVEITNVGTVPHYYALGTLPEGATADDYRAFLEADYAAFSGMAATPVTTGPLAGVTFDDIEEVFGTADQSAGVTAWYAIELAPGTYGAACFERDRETLLPHAVLGEVAVVVVA